MNNKMPAVIAYIPALHKGYLDFFEKYRGGNLYILSAEFINEIPRMDRDIRAVAPEEIKKAVAALDIFAQVEVLNDADIPALRAAKYPIFMPDEDLSRVFAGKHLEGKPIEFVSTFLRWDKQISSKETEVSAGRTVSKEEFDKKIMSGAFREAERSPDWWRQVGGIVVKDGRPILSAHNKPLPSDTLNIFGDPRSNFDAGQNIELSKAIHAEASLIAEAARRGIPLGGASIYVTTFPCPVCARLVATAGIKKIFYSKGYSLLDAEDIFRATGIEIVMVK